MSYDYIPKRKGNWKGGINPCKDGLRITVSTKKRTSYARWLYEDTYNVKLQKDEVIWHKDKNKLNNAIENLILIKRKDILKYNRRDSTTSYI